MEHESINGEEHMQMKKIQYWCMESSIMTQLVLAWGKRGEHGVYTVSVSMRLLAWGKFSLWCCWCWHEESIVKRNRRTLFNVGTIKIFVTLLLCWHEDSLLETVLYKQTDFTLPWQSFEKCDFWLFSDEFHAPYTGHGYTIPIYKSPH